MKKLPILFLALFFVLAFSSLCVAKTSSVEKFALKVVELVIKQDANSIYDLGTEGFKNSLTIDQLKNMLNTVFSYYKGKPQGGEFIKMKYYPTINATELWFKMNFKDKKWLFIGCIVQEIKGKLYLYGLRLKAPPEFTTKAKKLPSSAIPPIKFARSVLSLIEKGNIEEVMNLIYEKVKHTVDEKTIFSFLSSLKGIKITEVKNFNQNFLRDADIYNIRFKGILNNSPVEIEISLRKEKQGQKFYILDINAYKK